MLLSIETKVVFEFNIREESHKLKFKIRGGNFEGIKTKARELQSEIKKLFPEQEQKAIESHIKIDDAEIVV